MSTPGRSLTVGAVLFPGFELLDVYGPLEMFGMLREEVALTILMLAMEPGAVRSSQGPRGVADVAMRDADGLDVLLVPGGQGARAEVDNACFLGELRRLAARSRHVTSVCTGGALLARAGLLDGRRATSNKRAFDWVTAQGPAVRWVREARWVEDGDVFTSSGVSAGMDMALGLIGRLYGRETSLRVARRAEYTWAEDREQDPFA